MVSVLGIVVFVALGIYSVFGYLGPYSLGPNMKLRGLREPIGSYMKLLGLKDPFIDPSLGSEYGIVRSNRPSWYCGGLSELPTFWSYVLSIAQTILYPKDTLQHVGNYLGPIQ